MAGLRLLLAFATSTALIISPYASAEVYKTVDDHGNVIYTDKESDKAETIELRPIQTIPAPSVHPEKKARVRKSTANIYTSVTITSPGEQEVFRNPDEITVTVQVDPALGAGHRYRLLVNGKVHGENQKPSFILKHPERGALVLKAEVINARGKVLISGEPRTIFVHRASALFRSPAKPDSSKSKS